MSVQSGTELRALTCKYGVVVVLVFVLVVHVIVLVLIHAGQVLIVGLVGHVLLVVLVVDDHRRHFSSVEGNARTDAVQPGAEQSKTCTLKEPIDPCR